MLSRKPSYNYNLDYKSLAKTLDFTAALFNQDEIKFTPILNMGKPTAENLKKFKKIYKNKNLLHYVIYLCSFVPRILSNILIAIIHHIYSLGQMAEFNSQLKENKGIIFLSHFTGVNVQENKEDSFFGSIPNVRNNDNAKNVVLLINHKKGRIKSRYIPISTQTLSAQRILLPKTTKTTTVIKILLEQFNLFYIIINKTFKLKNLNFSNKIILLELALQQFCRPALANRYLLANIVAANKIIKGKKLIVTFEGHSYETYIARQMKKIFSKLEISVYQFAPVVPAQHSFFTNIDLLPNNVKVFVTGQTIKQQLTRNTRIKANRIHIIGSNKNSQRLVPRNMNKKNIVVLFGAEGSPDSLEEFLKLSFFCAAHLKNAQFILRSHPAYIFKKADFLKRIPEELTNVTLSENSLEADLSLASFCVYRSSALGIQCLPYGVTPIHFSHLANGDLDPLSLTSLSHPQINSSKELANFLQKFSSGVKGENAVNLRVYRSIFNQYFHEINEKKLRI